MKFAVLSIDKQFVDNVIVANEAQREELEKALDRTLINASPLGLTVGDYYNGVAWTRNVEGEQVALPLSDGAESIETLAILNGEIEDDVE